MKLLKQAIEQNNLKQSKRIVYENVKFCNGFIPVLEALAINGLINKDYKRVDVKEGYQWADTRKIGGLLIETLDYPITWPEGSSRTKLLIFEGVDTALELAETIMLQHGVVTTSPRIGVTINSFIASQLFEMTRRTGMELPHSFPDFSNMKMTFEGKMQHGYEVFSVPYQNTLCYVIKIGNEYSSMIQLHNVTIPKIGKVLESDSSLTDPKFAGNLLSFKLKHFLINHLGKSILLGNVHSIATEQALPKITKMFQMKMVNIKTGEMVDWTVENYKKLSHEFTPTDWQVLLLGSNAPFNQMECWSFPGEPGDRHKWTYFNWFEGLEELLEDC